MDRRACPDARPGYVGGPPLEIRSGFCYDNRMDGTTAALIYYDLLDEAFQTSQALDLFDLDMEDPASVKQWSVLEEADARAQAVLIVHVAANATLLLIHFQSMLPK